MQIGDKVLYKSKAYEVLEIDPYQNGVVLEVNGEREWILNDHIKEVKEQEWKPLGNFYPENDFEMAISNICDEIKETLIKKNRDYGNSYMKLKEKFGDMALIIRESDKLNRLETLATRPHLVNESTIDTKLDGAGYYILDLACERVRGCN